MIARIILLLYFDVCHFEIFRKRSNPLAVYLSYVSRGFIDFMWSIISLCRFRIPLTSWIRFPDILPVHWLIFKNRRLYYFFETILSTPFMDPKNIIGGQAFINENIQNYFGEKGICLGSIDCFLKK